MRLICCMGGTGGGKGGRRQTKNREMEKKDAGREQEKVKKGGQGWAYWAGGEACAGRCMHGAPCQRRGKELGSKRRSGAKRSGQPAPHKALRDWQARPSKMKIS